MYAYAQKKGFAETWKHILQKRLQSCILIGVLWCLQVICTGLYSEIIFIILHWLQSHLVNLYIKKAGFNTGLLQGCFFSLSEWLIFFCFSQLATLQAWIRIWSGDVNEELFWFCFVYMPKKIKKKLVLW